MAGIPPPDWVVPYIGLPWQMLGRTREGLDCWGLVRLVLAERWGVAVPAFDGAGWTGQRKAEDIAAFARFITGHMPDWKSVGWVGRREGDGVLLRVRGRPVHIGLIVAPEWFLHILSGHNAAVERFDSIVWRDRIAGAYRHVSMA
jgi:cell wall-associated NlpC family hydrolase